MGYELVKDMLEELDLVSPRYSAGDTIAFRCPVHADRVASGSLSEGEDGRALLYCHGGCETERIVEELGLEMKDLFVGDRVEDQYYDYTDERGRPLYRVVRFKPKAFTQERYEKSEGRYVPGLGDVQRVLYNLRALAQAQTVYVVEGEKDADRLNSLGVTATCNVGGASNWRPEWAESLRGKDVIIVPDNDEPGEKHARTIQASLDGVARSVRVKYAARGKDISDHLDAGFDLSQLVDEPSPEEEFNPLDWETYKASDTEWLMEPYFPARGRVLVYGKAGSLKSLWVMWVATRLAKEGKRVAYFSLEMRPQQTVERLKKLRPPRANFKVFTNYKLGNPDHLRRTIEALRGYDIIIVDSLNAAFRFMGRGTHDDQFAELDDTFFQPVIEGTGATLVLVDNTGHDVVVGFGTRTPSQHPRGTSAKIDKMDVGIFLHRPDEQNNYLTEIHVKKMRYDLPIPARQVVCAPSSQDGIEFYIADPVTGEPKESLWREEDMMPDMDTPAFGREHTEDLDADDPSTDTGAGNNPEEEIDFEDIPIDERIAFLKAQKVFDELKIDTSESSRGAE